MCGIIGYTGKGSTVDIMLKGLEALRYRGYDSAGIATIYGKEIKTVKTVGNISELRENAEKENIVGSIGIGHTRWATHGKPCLINAHPILSPNKEFAVVHNGIIENYSYLKKELMEKGITFSGETDTEVIAALLQMEYKGSVLAAVRAVLSRLKGSFALGIVSVFEPDTLIAARMFSPLIIGSDNKGNYISSDISALLPFTRKVLYLEDGEIAEIKADKLTVYSALGQIRERTPQISPLSFSEYNKGSFDYYMMKEIKEQPEAIKRCLEKYIDNRHIDFKSLNFSKEALLRINKIHIVACGSAYHAGMVGKYIFEELIGIPTFVDTAGEYRYRKTPTDKNTLVFAISQSGETADTLAAAKKAKESGAYLISVVNVEGSSLVKISHDVLYTLAGAEISVATTKGYSTQLIILYLFAVWAAEKTGKISEKSSLELINEIKAIPQKTEKIFALEESVSKIAKEAVQNNLNTIFFIGRNTDYAVALEASLKLKEISYINSSAFASAELKHGTISLIEEGSVVAALCCKARLIDKMYSNIKEVKARGAFVASLTLENEKSIEEISDKCFSIPKIHELFSASLEVIPFQLFAYYIALYKGLDIDKPRNLAKSVTVE